MEPLKYQNIYGSWATLILSTEENGDLNYSKLSDEIDILIASGSDGIYSNGTAGEFYSQSEDEFDRISELLSIKCNKAGVPFQIGVSHMSPQISLSRLSRIKHLKPGAVQVILPDWFPVTSDEAIIFLQKMEDEANGVSLILYNPPHAKRELTPDEWMKIKKMIPSFEGVKVSDRGGDLQWYRNMIRFKQGLSVFIPGHRIVTGITNGADGAYSNVACLNPFMAQKWYLMIKEDLEAAFDLEKRMNIFMEKLIIPFIAEHHYANHACDRFMALLGGWADVGTRLRWPYKSIPVEFVDPVRDKAIKIIPEFFEK